MDSSPFTADAGTEGNTYTMSKHIAEQLKLIPSAIEDSSLTEEEELDRQPQVEGIETDADFISFVIELRDDYLDYSEDWTNPDLGAFLDALATCAGEILVDGLSQKADGANAVAPTWRRFAEILQAAKYYPDMGRE
jgi:hypothetical protein